MKLSTQTAALFPRLGEDEALKLFAKVGYEALDYSMFMISRDPDCVWHHDNWREYAKELRKKCEDLGMYFNQGHAPFNNYPWNVEGVYENRFIPDTLQSIEISGLLGIRNLVIHPLHHFLYKGHEEEIFEKNVKFYTSLIPYAEEAGVNISIENMWQTDPMRKYCVDDTCASAEEFVRYIDTMNSYSPIFNACLDIGHVVLVGREPSELIEALGSRLDALHVHDNDYKGDQHQLIGMGKIDYNAVMTSLKKVGYKGEFTYEADRFLAGFTTKEQTELATKYMADIGKYWIRKFDEAEV